MKHIILDRDGVINVDSPDFIKSEAEWIPIPGSLEAIATLNQKGFTVSVITNQSGLARGLFNLATLHKIHQKMHKMIAEVGGKIDAIFFCPHHPQDNCACRKPKPGMILQMADHYHLELKNAYIPCVGDSLRDLEAAQAANCQPLLVLTGNGHKTLLSLPEHLKEVKYFNDLSSLAAVL